MQARWALALLGLAGYQLMRPASEASRGLDLDLAVSAPRSFAAASWGPLTSPERARVPSPTGSMAPMSGRRLAVNEEGPSNWWTSRFVRQLDVGDIGDRNFTHGSFARSVAWSKDRSLLVVGGGNYVRLFQTNGGMPGSWGFVKVLGNHDSTVTSVSFSGDSTMVVSGGHDKKVRLFSVDPKNPRNSAGFVKVLGNHDSSVYSVSFSGDSTMVVSGGYDKKVKLFSVDPKNPRRWKSQNWSNSSRNQPRPSAMLWMSSQSCCRRGNIRALFFIS